MKKIQGEQNTFIEFLKNKADIKFEETKREEVLTTEVVKTTKEITSLAQVLDEKVKDVELKNFDVEESLVKHNREIINKVRFEFFRDFSKQIKTGSLDTKVFGKAISSKYLVPSLAIGCTCLIIFSVLASSARVSDFASRVSISNKTSDNQEVLNRESVHDFILKNSDINKGRVAGAEEGIGQGLPTPPAPPSITPDKPRSEFMKTLSSLAAKQVELSSIMNNKLLKLLNRD